VNLREEANRHGGGGWRGGVGTTNKISRGTEAVDIVAAN